jgi:hypothetical protein
MLRGKPGENRCILLYLTILKNNSKNTCINAEKNAALYKLKSYLANMTRCSKKKKKIHNDTKISTNRDTNEMTSIIELAYKVIKTAIL